jgi:DNA repair protein RadC
VTRFLNDYMPLADDSWYIGLIRELHKKVDSNGYATLGKYAISFLDRVLGTNRSW